VSTINNLRLIGISGTNKVMTGELSRLARRAIDGVRLPQPKKQGLGALLYPFDRDVAAVAVSYHRTCSRVLWDLFESSARRLEPLYDELLADMSADDREWLWDGASISIRARNVQSFAAGERQVVGTVKNALFDGARARGMRLRIDADDPDIHIAVRMHDGVLSVSVDLAGGPMHQRGYRVQSGDAPLRENLAAVLVMLARFDARSELFIDPMAGSGTIAIEAALMARAASLWSEERQPAYLRLPAFAGFELRTKPLFPDSRPVIVASDIDMRAVEMMRANAEAAGVSEDLHIMHTDLRDLSPRVMAKRVGQAWDDKQPGVIISNPPYGERLAGGELDLYDDMGAWCEQFPGYRAAFLVANNDFEEIFGARARVRKPISNGSLRAYFSLYDL
jgi:23S rRNA G2445 N2-methylase RlmL